VEDPVRRVYKRILATSSICTCCLYVLIDLSFQIQSSVNSNYLTSAEIPDIKALEENSNHEANLGTTLYVLIPDIKALEENSNHEANLGTTLYVLLFCQQIINPLVFLYSEFLAK